MSDFRSSDTAAGPTIRRLRGKVLDVHAEHWWYRCSGGDCVQAFWAGNCVNVVDTKLGLASPIQRWESDEWAELLDAIREVGPLADGMDSQYRHVGVSVLPVSGAVFLGLERHEDLEFDTAEWNAFVVGVLAEAYEVDRLRSFAGSAVRGSGEVVELSYPASVLAGDAGEVGPTGDGSDRVAAGAGPGPATRGETAPAAASPRIASQRVESKLGHP